MTKQDSINDSKFVGEYLSNTKSDLIEITEDKLENILLKHIKEIEKRNNWQMPLSLFITILIVLLTTNFKEKVFSIEKDVWNAIFVILLVFTFIWFLITVYKAIKSTKSNSIASLINRIKRSEK